MFILIRICKPTSNTRMTDRELAAYVRGKAAGSGGKGRGKRIISLHQNIKPGHLAAILRTLAGADLLFVRKLEVYAAWFV